MATPPKTFFEDLARGVLPDRAASLGGAAGEGSSLAQGQAPCFGGPRDGNGEADEGDHRGDDHGGPDAQRCQGQRYQVGSDGGADAAEG